MKRIILIEPFEHREIIYRWLPVLLDKAETVELWVRNKDLLADATTDLALPANCILSYPKKRESFTYYLKRQCKSLTTKDTVIWLTLGLRYDWISLIPAATDCRVVVHNVQTLLAPQICWPPNLRQLRSLIRYYLSGQFLMRKRLLERAFPLILPTPELQQSAIDLGYATPKTQVISFAKREFFLKEKMATDTIVIPGSVNPKTRDYALVLEVMEQLAKTWNRPFQLLFLGKCPEKFIFYSDFTALADTYTHLTIQFFFKPISQAEYNLYLSQALALLLPLWENIAFGPFTEKMGTTKVSGGVFDALAYGLPLLLPVFYPLPNGQTAKHYRNATDCSSTIKYILENSIQLNSAQ